MRVTIRAFNKDGYHRDIGRMDEQQVLSSDIRCIESLQSDLTGLIGVGIGIDPNAFPEVVRFEVVIQPERGGDA